MATCELFSQFQYVCMVHIISLDANYCNRTTCRVPPIVDTSRHARNCCCSIRSSSDTQCYLCISQPDNQNIERWGELFQLFASNMAFLVAWLLIFSYVWPAWSWNECSISPEDEWKEATEPTPAIKMRKAYERGYTCSTDTEGMIICGWVEPRGKNEQTRMQEIQ